MTPATTTPALSAAQARQLHDAEVDVAKLEAQLDVARQKREQVRERLLPRVPLSSDAKDAEKGILQAAAGGVTIRVCPTPARTSFSLKRYTDLGHKITAAMREAIATGEPGWRWTVKRADGPKRFDAVEVNP